MSKSEDGERPAKKTRGSSSDQGTRERSGRNAPKHPRDDVLARERARERAAREDW